MHPSSWCRLSKPPLLHNALMIYKVRRVSRVPDSRSHAAEVGPPLGASETRECRGWVLVSFTRHGRSEVQSYPRKRESTPPAIGNAPPTDWIPACAGMTSASKGTPFQKTPALGVGASSPL